MMPATTIAITALSAYGSIGLLFGMYVSIRWAKGVRDFVLGTLLLTVAWPRLVYLGICLRPQGRSSK